MVGQQIRLLLQIFSCFVSFKFTVCTKLQTGAVMRAALGSHRTDDNGNDESLKLMFACFYSCETVTSVLVLGSVEQLRFQLMTK